MNLQCTACGHKVRLSDENVTKFAGRRVKCPGCGVPIEVPAASSAKLPQAAPLTAKPLSAAKPPAAAAPAAAAPATAKPPTAKPPANPFPSFDTPSAAAAPGFDTKPLGAAPRSPAARVAKKKSGMPLPLMIGGSAGAVVLVVVVVIAAVMFSNSGGAGAARDATGRSNLLVSGKGELTVLWPETERSNAEIQVDGTRMELPSTGKVSYLIAAGQHRVVIRRRGYEQFDVQVVVTEKQNVDLTPTWNQMIVATSGGGLDRFGNQANAAGGGYNPDAGYDSWLQNFDTAKTQAAANHKDVLLVFNGSDWNPYCIQLSREVLFDARFKPLVGSEYELVNIDFPENQPAIGKVENAARNESLEKQFEIEEYPTIVLTDSSGMPYAKLGYDRGGLPAFLEQVEAAQSMRQARDDIARFVESGNWEERKVYSQEFLKLMKTQDLEWYYSTKYQQWFDTARAADPDNRQGYNEHFFQFIWLARLQENSRLENIAGIRSVIDQLEQWKQKYTFRDETRAARMHLAAAMIMYQLKDADAVNRLATAGTKYATNDETVADYLDELSSMGDSINVLGNGTGFVIAPGGYVLTNHHVIEGDGNLAIRVPGEEQPVPCKVIAQDEEHDLALVKVDHPAMDNLKPMTLSLLPPELAMSICALGYPLSDSLGNQVKPTSGVISSTAESQRNGMLVIDCTVNPGNSGGPLFNTVGDVIGVVTAKSVARDGSEDTYGMAVPAETAVEFLKQHLPGYEPPAVPDPSEADLLPPSGNWSAVVREVKGSVLQILQLR